MKGAAGPWKSTDRAKPQMWPVSGAYSSLGATPIASLPAVCAMNSGDVSAAHWLWRGIAVAVLAYVLAKVLTPAPPSPRPHGADCTRIP